MRWGLRRKARRIFSQTADVLLPESALIAFSAIRRHRRALGVFPNVISPKTFSEKILHRLIFDRRSILVALQDKYAVRDYVTKHLGDHVLPRLYWVTKNPANIPLDDLPDRFVVKATHGCGWVYLVPDKARLDRQDLMAKSSAWLQLNYYRSYREWAYKHIEPRIIVEEYISDGTGPTPTDYKFYVFNGHVHLIWAMTGRFIDRRGDPYTPTWDRPDGKRRGKSIGMPLPRPPHLDEMIRCAEILGAGLDFVRVDLYDAGKVYFGEMTLYPSAGGEMSDPKRNRYFGELWDLGRARSNKSIANR